LVSRQRPMEGIVTSEELKDFRDIVRRVREDAEITRAAAVLLAKVKGDKA
jgi:hypothetical protein